MLGNYKKVAIIDTNIEFTIKKFDNSHKIPLNIDFKPSLIIVFFIVKEWPRECLVINSKNNTNYTTSEIVADEGVYLWIEDISNAQFYLKGEGTQYDDKFFIIKQIIAIE